MEWLVAMLCTIEDVFAYNEHKKLCGPILDRIEKELADFNSKPEWEAYTKEQYKQFHLDLIELGAATLPTTDKTIKRYGD